MFDPQKQIWGGVSLQDFESGIYQKSPPTTLVLLQRIKMTGFKNTLYCTDLLKLKCVQMCRKNKKVKHCFPGMRCGLKVQGGNILLQYFLSVNVQEICKSNNYFKCSVLILRRS